MKFVNTKLFQPVIYSGDHPHKHDLYHKSYLDIPTTEIKYIKYLQDNNIITDRSWWKKQYDRCINGYTVKDAIEKGGDAIRDGIDALWLDGEVYIHSLDYSIKGTDVWISGRMYFYLNFWSIKRVDQKTKRKLVGPPRFTSISWKNWMIRELSMQRQLDILFAKRRQVGLSEETAADLGYDFCFLSDTQNVIVAGEEKYATNTFKMVKRGLERLINTQFYKWTSVNNNEFMKAKYFGTELYCRTAMDNEQALSGLSPYKVLYEEGGIWKKDLLRQTLEFVNQSLEAEGQKTGQNIFIATAGDMNDSVADVEEMFYKPEKYNLMKFKNIYEKEVSARGADVAYFIPGWEFEVIDEDGNSLRKESEEKLIRDRNSKNKNERYKAITLKPFYPSELFSNVSGGYFGEEIIHMLNERKAWLYTHKNENKGDYYSIKWKDPNNWHAGVNIELNEEGEYFIMELPDLDSNGVAFENLYKSGTDPYDKDEANESSSKGSMHIFKGFKNANRTYKKYVARLVQRPKAEDGGAYKFYENTIKLGILYNVVNLIEYKNIRIFDYYERAGMDYLLKDRPDMIIARYIGNSKVANTKGIDPQTKPHWLANLKDYLGDRDNIAKLDDPQQIDAFAKFKYDPSGKKYNCDITISSSLALICYEDERELEVVETKNVDEDYIGIMVYQEINGVIQKVIR